ncbi:MAG: MBOAT family protein [Butyrivibrio sp.]|nr:MBOAT family protein [Butyrivibrio sp.]
MTFNSYIFIFIFLPVFLLGLYLLQSFIGTGNRKKTYIRLWIIACSAIFFVGYGMLSLWALLLSIAFNALWGFLIDKKGVPALPGVLVNVLFLCFFKYGTFTGMPIAVSFYTFQQIAFLVMLKKKEIEKFELLEYLSYILFFPKILQGPLADYRKVTDGINTLKDRRINSADVLDGLVLFVFGLSKKVLLSDALGLGADFGYSNLAGLSAIDAIIVALCYSLQLYFDFSGYCDMAEGVCKMMGMDLDVNFNAPYKAKNIAEFWDRWHITLTKFFTKYVYIPLGGSRKGTFRTYLNILIVFFVSGIWHGTGVSFIVWGMLHGILMVITRIYGRAKGTGDKVAAGSTSKVTDCIKIFLTFSYVTVAWVFFRANTVADALTLLGKIITPSAWSGLRVGIKLAECFQLDEIWYIFKVTPIPSLSFGGYVCMWLILLIALIFVFALKPARDLAVKIRKTPIAMVIIAFLFIWCTLSLGNVSTFLYVNF